MEDHTPKDEGSNVVRYCERCSATLLTAALLPDYPCPKGCWECCMCGFFYAYDEPCDFCGWYWWQMERLDFDAGNNLPE
jgi:hypothetical protein